MTEIQGARSAAGADRMSPAAGTAQVQAVCSEQTVMPIDAPPVASTAEVATRFYEAFVKGDHATMAKLYAPGAHFKDEVFEYDSGAGAMKMWTTLKKLTRGESKFSFNLEKVEGNVALVHWQADYQFNGRPIRNDLHARLEIRNGQIVNHRDTFDWNTWSKQALPLGPLSTSAPVRFALTYSLRALVHLYPSKP